MNVESDTALESSASFDYLRGVQELLELEELNAREGLTDEQRNRWRELNGSLFGLPDDLGEKREFFRVRTALSARLPAPDGGAGATVRSLSCGGMFLETGHRPEVGRELDLEVSFERRRSVTIPFRVEVRWVSPQRNSGAGFGVRFVDVDEEKRSAVLGVLRDRLLMELENAFEVYRFFFDHSPDASFLVDHNSRIVAHNTRGASLLTRKPGTLQDTRLDEIMNPEAAGTLDELISRIRAGAEKARVEIELREVESGDHVVLEVLAAPGRSGNLDLGTMLVGRDISDRRQVERQRRSLERRLYQADKLATLGRVAAGIAHDVNNPLAWVLSNLSLLQGYVSTLVELAESAARRPGSHEDLSDIAANLEEVVGESLEGIRRIRDIMRELKFFSRVDVDDRSAIDVNDVLDTACKILRNQLEQRARVVRDYGAVPLTFANFGKLSQLLINLIGNAAQAFDSPDVERNRVTLSSRVEANRILITVGDNGKGIPTHLQKNIFEPFFTSRPEAGGSGLGLPIARDATEALDGELTFTSEEGRGTEFIISLPVVEPERKGEPAAPSKTPIPRGQRPSLLVIDDERTLLRALKRTLRKRWRVTTAASAQEALDLFGAERFDAIACDVMIPGRSGLWLREELQRRHPGAELRMVFITGGAFTEREKTALEGLPNAVVEKPFDLEELEARLLDAASDLEE